MTKTGGGGKYFLQGKCGKLIKQLFIVIKQFHPKEGAWEGTEQLLNQLVAFALHCIPAEDLLPQRKHSWDEEKLIQLQESIILLF
jgi:hypothetical protein